MFSGSDSSSILMSFNCYHRPSTTLKSIYCCIVYHTVGTATLLNLLRLYMIWKALSGLSINIVIWLVVSVDPTCLIQVTQPSEGLFMWALSTGLAWFRISTFLFFAVKIAMCSYEKLDWPGYGNCYKEKSGEARSRKPNLRGWPGSYEEVTKQPEVKAQKPHLLYGPWGGENKLSHCYIPPSSLWYQYLAHSIFPRKARRTQIKKTDLINTSWIQSNTVIVHFAVTLTILRKISLWYRKFRKRSE